MDEDFEPPEVAYSEEPPLIYNMPNDVITPMGEVAAVGALARGLGRGRIIKILVVLFVLMLIILVASLLSA